MDTKHLLDDIVIEGQRAFAEQAVLLSLDEYLPLVMAHPKRHLRNAAQYLVDVFDHYGSETLQRPWGEQRRFKLFDAAFDDGTGRVIGQEQVQQALYRLLKNDSRAGRIDRMIVLHGPNGSAKTSIIHAMTRAAEVYSHQPDGAMYSINWVFPSSKVQKGSIGFGSEKGGGELGSYAHLDAKKIDARLVCEVKDHPLMLFTVEQRHNIVQQLIDEGKLDKDQSLPDVVMHGELCSKCRSIYDSLLASHNGDVAEVLRHVQVERFFLSRRYRRGIVSIEPQMSVDAYSRQVTADRSLASLPVELQNLSLAQSGGPLVDGNRGVIEYNDLLKRPIEAFKYLLSTTESSAVSLELTTVFLDAVLIASTNEKHLDAFKDYPDWPSFKGRMDLVPVPYLRSLKDEVRIYEDQIPRALHGRHIAPHALEVAARWAVMTRLEPPDESRYDDDIKKLVKELSPAEKLDLYDHSKAPDRLTSREVRDLRAQIAHIHDEQQDLREYEGRYGASVREVRSLFMNAAQNHNYHCLSPLAVLDELRALVRDTSVYDYLRRDVQRGYHNAETFVDQAEEAYLDSIDDEVRVSMGLVEEGGYEDLFARYVHHISAWVKKTKVEDPVSGESMDPDVNLMKKIESILLSKDESHEDFRHSIIGQIGAFALDNPDKQSAYGEIFPNHLRKIHADFFNQRREQVERAKEDFLRVVHGDTDNMDAKVLGHMREMLSTLRSRFGYCEHCAKDMVAYLMKKRYN